MRTFAFPTLDVLDCTPGQLQLWLASGLTQEGVPSLRRLLVGGERIGSELWRELRRLETNTLKVYNMYGPTECTVDTTVAALSEHAVPTLGRPLANVEVLVVEPGGQVCPKGAIGELYVGGLA